MVEKNLCLYCKSEHIIKHGTTALGKLRYRCRDCGKTHIAGEDRMALDLPVISEDYLNGYSLRDLAEVNETSALRLNKNIRKFLISCPPWEEYLDRMCEFHRPKLIFFVGRRFSCQCKDSVDNGMFVALAIDVLSATVLGYEVSPIESLETWENLIKRMHKRKISASTFLTNGSQMIEQPAKKIFPLANFINYFHRSYRDKELLCCLSRVHNSSKLVSDAFRMISSMEHKRLKKILKIEDDGQIFQLLSQHQDSFYDLLKDRMDKKMSVRVDSLLNDFQKRFEKFHMLKENPIPIINGWIALEMIHRYDNQFSRLSYYAQVPVKIEFKDFGNGHIPTLDNINPNSSTCLKFFLEISARSLELPIKFNECELKLDRCFLI